MTPPFAAPLRAVDETRVTETDGVLAITATKEIVATDPYLADHFPGRIIYPGVFILETVRQAVAAALTGQAGAGADISAVRSVRFTGAMHPGERLVVEATVVPAPGGRAEVDARCCRGDGSEVARLALEFGDPAGSDV